MATDIKMYLFAPEVLNSAAAKKLLMDCSGNTSEVVWIYANAPGSVNAIARQLTEQTWKTLGCQAPAEAFEECVDRLNPPSNAGSAPSVKDGMKAFSARSGVLVS